MPHPTREHLAYFRCLCTVSTCALFVCVYVHGSALSIRFALGWSRGRDTIARRFQQPLLLRSECEGRVGDRPPLPPKAARLVPSHAGLFDRRLSFSVVGRACRLCWPSRPSRQLAAKDLGVRPPCRPLVYGQSITDGCLGWDDTRKVRAAGIGIGVGHFTSFVEPGAAAQATARRGPTGTQAYVRQGPVTGPRPPSSDSTARRPGLAVLPQPCPPQGHLDDHRRILA